MHYYYHFQYLLLLLLFLTGHLAFETNNLEGHLKRIHQITTHEAESGCLKNTYELVPISFPTKQYHSEEELVELAANLIEDTNGLSSHNLIQSTLKHLLLSTDSSSSSINEYPESNFLSLYASLTTIILKGNDALQARVVSLRPFWCVYGEKRKSTELPHSDPKISNITSSNVFNIDQAPWMLSPSRKFVNTDFMPSDLSQQQQSGYWTYPYYSCAKRSWILSYVASISSQQDELIGFLSFDVNVTDFDIDQCNEDASEEVGRTPGTRHNQISSFSETHKCHRETSQCIFESGHGWTRGGYRCQCKPGYYSKTEEPYFNGSLVEIAYENKVLRKEEAYDKLYVCGKCQEGCETCVDDTPCLATYNWTFRYILLVFSLACTLATLILMGLVYSYRKLKVFRFGSPAFLCLTLLGCAIMYLEMVAIFPILDVGFCIATKWTRHMGFLLTYSSLLLKTWRVNLTFRVKSAHKLKLTDKQLLQWLFPILLVMMVYLSAWTLSDPPEALYISDSEGLKFKQCYYGWWDHNLGFGEVLFLLWGIKVCFNVRKARTHFNEAKLITWSIYNIAVVNIIMVAIHLVLFPNCGPDMKYFLGFLRTQLSTTVTIFLVFGPKFLRVLRGTANELDDRIRARGNAASMIEVPLEREVAQKDVYAENEELKEEIQKLAGQIQYLKIVGMLTENRHIKPKKDGYFSKESCSKHFNQFLQRNGTLINVQTKSGSTTNKGAKVACVPEETHPLNGDIRSPNSGQPVILAEKCEENSYTLIEPPAPPQPDRLSVNGQNHSKPARESNSSSIEDMANNTSSKHCETNSYREVSPSIEPFIPERV